MFDTLQDRLGEAFKKIRGHGKLTEDNIGEGLRDVRLALLEADVNYKVVRRFIARVKERSLGQEVIGSLTPGQQVVKVVYEELTELMGSEHEDLNLVGRTPHTVMLVGLQGSGKTTTIGKLAKMMEGKETPYLTPADVYRPAAIEQLKTLAGQLDVPVFNSNTEMDPVDICRQARYQAEQQGASLLLVDTAGRLHIDEELMEELVRIKDFLRPQEILFAADAMTGQDAVNAAIEFNQRLGLTGVVLTKMDGDARGGAALSIKEAVGVPIKFVGVGEKLDALEAFHPDRMASRILGMGDVLTLIEKAQQTVDQKEARKQAKRLKKGEFTLEDFLSQLKQIQKMGSLDQIMKMIPGMGKIKNLDQMTPDNKDIKRIEAIILSMTPLERRNPKVMNGSRRKRVAMGSGTAVADVNRVLKDFEQMRKMVKKMGKMSPARLAGGGLGQFFN